MNTELTWDADKQEANLKKHGLDFAQARQVLDSSYRLDVETIRQGEKRTLSFAYVLGYLAVLTLVHTKRGSVSRIISFRHASTLEREKYYEWLEQNNQ